MSCPIHDFESCAFNHSATSPCNLIDNYSARPPCSKRPVYTISMDDSVFTKIIKGEIPGEMVYQDDVCVVLMTIEPFTPGHCLVVPREQVDHLWDADDELYQHLMQVAKKVANAMRKAYNYPRVGQIVEGFGVSHAHIHLFGLSQPIEPTIAEHVANKRMATAEELHTEADKLRSVLA